MQHSKLFHFPNYFRLISNFLNEEKKMTMLKGAWYNKNRISLRRKKRMFNLIEMLFPIMFILIFIIIVFTFVKGIATWFKNNNSPRLTVSARIVAKRQNTTRNNQPNAGDISGAHGFHTISSTSYYVTFQVDSGDRMELSVSGSEYGVLAEGDKGQLTFQGTRYLTFDREN